MTDRSIVLSSDHAAIELRQKVAAHVQGRGYRVEDIGPHTPESTPYPERGAEAARRVANGDFDLGIILCGTGQGIMIAANKINGIRCGVGADPFSAKMIREHNDANMLALGARVIEEAQAIEIVDAFLDAEFEGGRHETRVNMITALEGTRSAGT